ncbi:MAG: methyltransferase family protein [Bacillota bacterium]
MRAPMRVVRRLTIGALVAGVFSVGLTGVTAGDLWLLAREGHSLVTQGIYGYARHPMYTGLLLVGGGVPLLARSPWGMAAALVLLTPAMVMRIREEEASLMITYGDDYRRYATRVRRLIPFVF